MTHITSAPDFTVIYARRWIFYNNSSSDNWILSSERLIHELEWSQNTFRVQHKPGRKYLQERHFLPVKYPFEVLRVSVDPFTKFSDELERGVSDGDVSGVRNLQKTLNDSRHDVVLVRDEVSSDGLHHEQRGLRRFPRWVSTLKIWNSLEKLSRARTKRKYIITG